jgi:putative flippase GtrA
VHPPDAGLASRGVRFALAGGAVTLLYLAVTTGLHEGLGAPFQVALIIGFATAVTTHFVLQRVLVWTHAGGFALTARPQAIRYLGVAAVQYATTAAATALLPSRLGVRVTYVYVATAALITVANFFVFRAFVFHQREFTSP